jgi:hypothetical protein
MKKWIVAISVVALIFLGLRPSHSGARSSSSSYKQDANGLEKEFEPFLKAYSKGDVAAQDEAFAVFLIPEGKAWFAEYFRPEDVEQLVVDSAAKVEQEKHSLRKVMGIVGRGERFHANCKPHAEDKDSSVKPRENAANPIKPVPIEQFNIKMQSAQSGKWFSSLGNFVYVDGAYRFLGNGTYPFWSMPDREELKNQRDSAKKKE